MSAVFNGSSNYLTNTAPAITNYPFTVGCWFRPTSTAAIGALWQLGDAATGLNLFTVEYTTAPAVRVLSVAAGVASFIDFGTVTANAWQFAVARYISSTNRRCSLLQSNGAAAAGQDTGSSAPSAATSFQIGTRLAATQYFTGAIGEFWYTATDIQADGAALDESMLRQLAYGGPFSVPHIAAGVIEYRGFRKFPSSEGDEAGEVYHRSSRQVWSNTNSVVIGAHPPLPYWYRNPQDYVQTIIG